MKIAAVIVTYNRLSRLRQSLVKTLAQDFSLVIVVNNASTDGTREWLDSCVDSRLYLIHLPENTGGAGGFAEGLAVAGDSDVDWVICYDDDAYPQDGALAAFRQENHDTFVAAAAAVYDEDGVICEMNRPSWNPFWHKKKLLGVGLGLLGLGDSRAAFHVSDEQYEGEALAIDSSSFVGFFIRRDWIHCIPLPDKDLFIYGDDILYTLTLSKAGGRIVFLPHVKFSHATETMERGDKLYRPLWKNYFHFRNLILIYRLAAGWWFYAVWPIKYWQWRRYARQVPVEDRNVYLRMLQHGVRDGLRGKLNTRLEQVKAWSDETNPLA